MYASSEGFSQAEHMQRLICVLAGQLMYSTGLDKQKFQRKIVIFFYP